MEIIRKERKLCPYCMEEHDVLHVRMSDSTVFKGQLVEYQALCEYCDRADEYWETDEYISQNHNAIKDAYDKVCLLKESIGCDK